MGTKPRLLEGVPIIHRAAVVETTSSFAGIAIVTALAFQLDENRLAIVLATHITVIQHSVLVHDIVIRVLGRVDREQVTWCDFGSRTCDRVSCIEACDRMTTYWATKQSVS